MHDRPALVIAAAGTPDPFHDALVTVTAAGLETNWPVEVLDLDDLGFVPRMSEEERRAYHGDAPILDPMVREHAALVDGAGAFVFVFPTRWWQPVPTVKAWLERVLVPGVGFVFDDKHRVRPNLGQLGAVAGVTTYDMSRREVRRGGNGSKRIILRALRANIPHRIKRSWSGLYDAPAATSAQREQFLASIERKMAEL